VKKTNWTTEQEAEINRIQRTTGVTRKTAIRKMRAAAKVQAKVKAVKTTSLRTVPPKQAQKSIPGTAEMAALKPPNCGFADVQGFFQSVRAISSSTISCNRCNRRSWRLLLHLSWYMRAVRFANLGYFFSDFLDTL